MLGVTMSLRGINHPPQEFIMNMLRTFLSLAIALWCSSSLLAEDFVFEGPWHTTNRRLDGIMTCEVREVSPEKWRGRFYGVWQGVAFDYTVAFSGPPTDLRGTASIDGADYTWKGKFEGEKPGFTAFKGVFGGTRYTGHFEMKPKVRVAAAR
jgi:hypothetical protein